MRDFIVVTATDLARLRRLVDGQKSFARSDSDSLDKLEQELDRAEVVDAADVPDDLITMNSEVRLKDLDTGNERVYRLIFPTQERRANGVSILAPIGTAILGYRVGDVIEWKVPRGLRRFQVLEVVNQTEPAAVAAD